MNLSIETKFSMVHCIACRKSRSIFPNRHFNGVVSLRFREVSEDFLRYITLQFIRDANNCGSKIKFCFMDLPTIFAFGSKRHQKSH
jgi:hypothetical protein